MKKLLTRVLLVLILVPLIVAAVWFVYFRPGVPLDSYTLAPVEWGTISEVVGATGLLQPRDVSVVSSPLSGQVVEIYADADVNKMVREGDPVLRLDDRLAREKLSQADAGVRMALADVARAEAARDAARTELQRAHELDEKNLASRTTVELAQIQLRAAEGSVAAARAKVAETQALRRQAELGVEMTVVRVPSSPNNSLTSSTGKRTYTIIDRKVVFGQLVAPPDSARLFTLAADLGQMRVHAQLGEDDVGKIYPGLTASFSIHAGADEETTFQGRVAEIRPVPSRLHGAVFYETRIDIANRQNSRTREWLLRPGMTVSANITLREHRGVWKIPGTALEVQIDRQNQSDTARAKLARWEQRGDAEEWKTAWILDANRKPWPVFVRIGGKNSAGEPGIANGQFIEVLQWDPELEPKPDPKEPATYPRVITGVLPGQQPGLLDNPRVKVF